MKMDTRDMQLRVFDRVLQGRPATDVGNALEKYLQQSDLGDEPRDFQIPLEKTA